jgi:hypothetical protein
VLHRVCPRIVRLFLFSGDSPLIEGFGSLANLPGNSGTDPEYEPVRFILF